MSARSFGDERQLANRLFISLIPLVRWSDIGHSLIGALWLPTHYFRVYAVEQKKVVAIDFSLVDENSSKLWAVWHVIGALRFVAAGKWRGKLAGDVKDPMAERVYNISQAVATGELEWGVFANELTVNDVACHVLADMFDLPPDSEAYEALILDGFLARSFLGFFLVTGDILRLYFRKPGFPGVECALGENSIGFDVALRDHYGIVRTYPIFSGSQISALLGAAPSDLPVMFPTSSFDGICCRVFSAPSV
jgi:hypothetical protein